MDVKDVCEGFNRALDLELEGEAFYLGCAKKTYNKDGSAMFEHLASEERVHFNNIAEVYKRLYDEQYCMYVDSKKEYDPSGVFEEKVPGGSLDDMADALDALNIAIKAEENSIDLYNWMSANAPDDESKIFFEKMVKEEEKHRSILESEAEFVTETGEFHDFKTVTM
ncbi:MAG: hypothetical protein GF416_04615 [Candidatus Altiarchaeales archaeon]|nr:hypothetical protein [Candidatus Altiarchaeales archaeon]MBD3416403.1 hypothetical protein [Candidatus Altiarchaeales archaeon]